MTDYKSIADRAVQIIGSADPAQYDLAYSTMVSETVTELLTSSWHNELSIISKLGLTNGNTILDKIAGAVPSRVQRLIQSDKGVNLADNQTIALLNSLLTANVITSAEMNSLTALTSTTKPKWPGLKPGHVQNALEFRAGGII